MTRYTIDVDPEFDALLSELARLKGGRKSEVIRDAVASYAFLKRSERQENRKVSITDDADHVIKDVVLP